MSEEMYYGRYRGRNKEFSTRPSYYEYIDYSKKHSMCDMNGIEDDPADWKFMFLECWSEQKMVDGIWNNASTPYHLSIEEIQEYE